MAALTAVSPEYRMSRDLTAAEVRGMSLGYKSPAEEGAPLLPGGGLSFSIWATHAQLSACLSPSWRVIQ